MLGPFHALQQDLGPIAELQDEANAVDYCQKRIVDSVGRVRARTPELREVMSAKYLSN
jgi:hypothetical protein